jgi:Patatin-like phospholipase
MTSLAARFAESTKQFRREVLRQELAYVRQRWQTVYSRRGRAKSLELRRHALAAAQEIAGADAAAEAVPAAGNGLVGLAFSGGGIRSATINLGVAQALHRRGVLDHVDYVSTVSGGGYLGSSLSTIMRDGAEFPFEHREGPIESPYLTWLRNHSNYLAQRGFLDYARIAAVLLRGVLVNFLVLVPFLLLLGLGFALWAQNPVTGGTFFRGDNWGDSFWLTRIGLAVAVLYMLAFPVLVRVFKVLGRNRSAAAGSESSVKLRDKFERSFSAVLLGVAGLAALDAIPILLHYFHLMRGDTGFARDVAAGIAGGSSIVALTVVGKLMTYFKGVAKTVAIWVAGLLGLLLPLLIVLHVAEGLIWLWEGNPKGQEIAWLAWALLAVVVGLMTGGALASAFAGLLTTRLFRRLGGWLPWWGTVLGGAVGFALGGGAILIWAWLVRENLGASPLAPELFIAVLAFTIWLFCWLSVDVNLTSIHGFYRDRLASAYLVGVDTDRRRGATLDQIVLDDVDIEEDLNLQNICQGEQPGESPSIAPYHIVNVAHNLQKSKDPSIRERNSDFFMFSKKFYGGTRTGYSSTAHLEAVFPQMDLATAMAISAAAASPNMGGGTIGSLVAVMTLFNIRLGYWVPNPARLAPWVKKRGEPLRSTIGTRFSWRIRPSAFIKEMWSSLNETARWVNLSDGGHIENLAVYELLRRRCKYIIAGDGEADSAMIFNSLARLKRLARIDLGIEIDILVDDLRRGEGGLSHQHCAFGTITYPELDAEGHHETGTLLYVKSSVSGDEDEVIRQYRARHPQFPHESTADQFFDEGQFEAYRALGFHIADGLFEPGQSVGEFAAFAAWFDELSHNLAPTLAAETLLHELRSELNSIQELLQQDDYSHYFYDLYPDLRPAGYEPPATGGGEASGRARRDLFLVSKQLRLMDNVFVTLDLDRPRNRGHEGNRGWMRLFQRWAEAWKRDPSFVTAYESEIRLHNWKLREFCVGVLGLPEPKEPALG